MTVMVKNDYIRRIEDELYGLVGKSLDQATDKELYLSLGGVLRKEVARNYKKRNDLYREKEVRSVHYLSMEFLTGTFSKKNLLYMDIYKELEEAFDQIGRPLEGILAQEKDPGLGNGGLGRLAVAFLDSLASMKMPGHGYGLRYEKGLFKQEIKDNKQIEHPDNWNSQDNVWEFKREDLAVEVRLEGYIDITGSSKGLDFNHKGYTSVRAVPYDIPFLGYKNNVVNYLRLWSAESYEDVDFAEFAKGDYRAAFNPIVDAKSLVQFLYPEDSNEEGKKLRLKQEYFLVSASMQDLVRSYKEQGLPIEDFHKHRTVQINDTHPALAIPELMRILMDEEKLEWQLAWDITSNTIAFTNHTILAEAMETWDLGIFKEILPRLWLITEEINHRFIYFLRKEKRISDNEILESLSIVGDNRVRMVNLSIMGSYSVNGVAELHTEILKKKVLNKFYKVFPEKFNNKTNGITHRRWLLNANPKLSNYIEELIGDGFVHNPWELEKLLAYENDNQVLENLAKIKHSNKERLAKYIYDKQGIKLNPSSIFDIHIKRIHEYKRQFLNILHVIYLYDKLKENPNLDILPRTFIFGGKAAPGYHMAKEIVKLINSVAHVVNNDLTIKDKIKVVFIEDYGISQAELLFPAADVSEQISTTTKEASGTGNMKFMMNGAVTLATLDGANVEISRAVGEDNIVIFGLRSHEVYEYYEKGNYNSFSIYKRNPVINKLVNMLISAEEITNNQVFPDLFNSVTQYNDDYFILRDFDSYREAQEKVDSLYRDFKTWNRMSLINIAKSGEFSSDNTIRKYGEEIWKIDSLD